MASPRKKEFTPLRTPATITNPEVVEEELTPDDLRRAALVVCGHAHSVDDARELLDALGLVG